MKNERRKYDEKTSEKSQTDNMKDIDDEKKTKSVYS